MAFEIGVAAAGRARWALDGLRGDAEQGVVLRCRTSAITVDQGAVYPPAGSPEKRDGGGTYLKELRDGSCPTSRTDIKTAEKTNPRQAVSLRGMLARPERFERPTLRFVV